MHFKRIEQQQQQQQHISINFSQQLQYNDGNNNKQQSCKGLLI